MIPVERLAATYAVPVAMLEDSPTLARLLDLRLRGFGLRRCDECGRRLRCVWTLPDPVLGWDRPRLVGRTCYRKG